MKLFFALVLFAPLSAYAVPASHMLEARFTNGPGWLISDIFVNASDGAVMVSKFTGPGNPPTPYKQIATLSAAEVADAENEIAALPRAPLVRLDPHQNFNPGGFGSSYLATKQPGDTMEFARNVSGVDYGFPGNADAAALTALLNRLAKLAQ